jgi:pimeloyl-ACP methyl ester carboxylesterase
MNVLRPFPLGTRQLAEDIERVRRIFGDQPLSVYGISYGTGKSV